MGEKEIEEISTYYGDSFSFAHQGSQANRERLGGSKEDIFDDIFDPNQNSP